MDRSRSEAIEDKNMLSSLVVLFLYRFSSQAHLNLEATRGTENSSSKPLTMVMTSPNKDTFSLVPSGILISLKYSDHFPVDPATAPINASGHQLVTLCRSIFAEQRAQILDPLIGRK